MAAVAKNLVLNGVADKLVTEETTEAVSLGYALSVGLVPWNPAFWVIQIPVAIITIIIFVWVFGVSWKYALLAGYIAQAAVTIPLAKWGFNWFLAYMGLGKPKME